MNRPIELTAIDGKKETAWLNDLRRAAQPEGFREVDFDEDDLERPVNEDEESETPAAPATPLDTSSPPAGVYSPIMVFENDLREIYPRKGDRAGMGSRIVYRSGANRRVKESYEEIKAKFAAMNEAPAARPRSRASAAA